MTAAFNFIVGALDHSIPRVLGNGLPTTLLTMTGRLGAASISLVGLYLVSEAVNDTVGKVRESIGALGQGVTAKLPDNIRALSNKIPNLLPKTDASNMTTSEKIVNGLYACVLGVLAWEAMRLLAGPASPHYNNVARLLGAVQFSDESYLAGARRSLEAFDQLVKGYLQRKA